MSDDPIIIVEESSIQNTENQPPEVPRIRNDPQTVKHSFVHMCLDVAWLEYPFMMDVNMCLMVSVDGAPWHGKAVYTVGDEGGKWTLLYHWKRRHEQVEAGSLYTGENHAYLALNENSA